MIRIFERDYRTIPSWEQFWNLPEHRANGMVALDWSHCFSRPRYDERARDAISYVLIQDNSDAHIKTGDDMKTRQLVPMISVADVERSIAFYQHLGFEVGNTFATADAMKPTWAWLQSGEAQLMVAAESEPVGANQHLVLFYVYTDDVAEARASLVEAGLNPGEITTPFYAPRGEFQLVDPDGYVVMVTHT